MLILTRKIGQSVVIAGNITIKILNIQRDRVQLGITADPNIEILREELII